MRISLIGMSNTGKTYWAKELERLGFLYFSCDDLIEEKLSKELKKFGYSGISDVAKWMGQPYEVQYFHTSSKYLEFEVQVMESLLHKLEQETDFGENVVIDTTGSVIYTGDKIMNRLGRLTRIVCLDIPETVKEEMYKNYIKNPKPVIWGESFNIKDGEPPRKALARCFPDLLDYRTKIYQKFAHVRLDYFLLRSSEFGVERFLNLLEKKRK